MANVAVGREERERRDGWTRGPGLVLADGETWHLPAIDAGLIPSLIQLARYALVVRDLPDPKRRRTKGGGMPVVMADYLVEALASQYLTDRATLAGLTPRVVIDEAMNPDRGMVLARHLADVIGYANRIGLTEPDGSTVAPSVN